MYRGRRYVLRSLSLAVDSLATGYYLNPLRGFHGAACFSPRAFK
jgi:hypothetical protein